MSENADPRLMTRIEYAELLVGQALGFNRRTNAARRMRKALLLAALQELQAEIVKSRDAHQSE
jgi:hypothetical protein